MGSCSNCGATLRAGEGLTCKSCRQTQKEKAHVQALAETRAAALAPPPSPPKKKLTKKEPEKRLGRLSRKS
jgi:hypothetical protein